MFIVALVLVACTTATSAPTPAPTASVATAAPPPTVLVSPATCQLSSDCAGGALCCPSVNAPAQRTPFGLSHSSVNVCATDPLHECAGHELCQAGSCRVPWPAPEAPILPTRTYTAECITTRDCPKDTVCTLFYAAAPSSLCVYSVASEPQATSTAPVCATDEDCKAALPRWKSVLSAQGEDAYPDALAKTRCVALKNEVHHRRACTIPGFSPLP